MEDESRHSDIELLLPMSYMEKAPLYEPLKTDKSQKALWLKNKCTEYEWDPNYPFPPIIGRHGYWIAPYWDTRRNETIFGSLDRATPSELANAESF